MKYNKEILAELLLEFTDEFGYVPAQEDIDANKAYPSVNTYKSYFTSFCYALEYAGLPYYRYTDESLILLLLDYRDQYNKMPLSNYDLIGTGYPSIFVFKRHFNSLKEAIYCSISYKR